MSHTRRSAICMALSLPGFAACFLLGCSSSSPTIPTAAKQIDQPQEDFKVLPKPKESDPKAKKLLEEVLAAHTNGKPEKLDAFRSFSMTRSGVIGTGQSDAQTAEWSCDMNWPKQYRYQSTVTKPPVKIQVMMGTDAKPWYRVQFFETLNQEKPSNTESRAANEMEIRNMKAQQNEDAFSALFPLRDATTVVTLANDSTIGGNAVLGLHVWSPALEYTLVFVDKTTKRLVRFRCVGVEMLERGQFSDVVKTYTLAKEQEFQGVLLPVEAEVAVLGRTLGRWTKLNFEGGKSFPAKHFESP